MLLVCLQLFFLSHELDLLLKNQLLRFCHSALGVIYISFQFMVSAQVDVGFLGSFFLSFVEDHRFSFDSLEVRIDCCDKSKESGEVVVRFVITLGLGRHF